PRSSGSHRFAPFLVACVGIRRRAPWHGRSKFLSARPRCTLYWHEPRQLQVRVIAWILGRCRRGSTPALSNIRQSDSEGRLVNWRAIRAWPSAEVACALRRFPDDPSRYNPAVQNLVEILGNTAKMIALRAAITRLLQ